jgi:hypothetical protein
MRFSDFKIVESRLHLTEAEARIDHAEDIIFWEGSKGAIRAIDSLSKLEDGQHKDVTIKWDGSPALIFGRDENGEFLLTDKSGFTASGYDGKAKSANDLEAMLLNRKGASNPDEAKRASYLDFVGNMKDIFDEYAKALPKDFRGYFKGDLLYYNTPPVIEDKITFTPNIVTYEVEPQSEIGKRILSSKTGVVVHRYIDLNGTERPVTADEINNLVEGNEVLVFPPVTPQKAPKVNDNVIRDLKTLVSKNAADIDKMLNVQTLTELKMKDLSKIFYSYINKKVDIGLENLGNDFFDWLKTSKVSQSKQKRIAEYIQQNIKGFNAMWNIVKGIIDVKNDIIKQFDSHEADIVASIGKNKGGEGYVLAHPGGDIKLVNRSGFTAANRSVER